jgi:alpha-1,4-fucosyltransferase
MLVRKRINYVAQMLGSAAILLLILLSGYFELPSIASLNASPAAPVLAGPGSRNPDAFTSLLAAFRDWDAAVGCPRVRAKLAAAANATAAAAITGGAAWSGTRCEELPAARHVAVLVKGWTWIPDALDGVYTCRCGVSCVWSKSAAAVDRPDALLFEGATPPPQVLRALSPYFLFVSPYRMACFLQCYLST